MGIFGSGTPVIVKENTSATDQLATMREMLDGVDASDRNRLTRDIALLEAGLAGEDKVLFELRNSHLDICVIRDLKLRKGDLTAQLDFLVLMPYVGVVIECKQLVGDIEINGRGEFIRTFGSGRMARREGMYSPITQNDRHLSLIMEILRDRHPVAGAITGIFDKIVGSNAMWDSLVVLANPKSVLTMKDAPADIQKSVVRADGLIERLKELDRQGRRYGNPKFSLKENVEIAKRWVERGVDEPADLSGRYAMRKDAGEKAASVTQGPASLHVIASVSVEGAPACPRCGAPMVLRTAKRGKRAGTQFWGCSTYPKCRGIINLGS